MRFGERFSYCDPQIPASAGVRPCVCFSVSWVEFSGRASPGSFGIFMELANGRSPQPVFASCRDGTAIRGSSGGRVVLGVSRGHIPGVLLVECGRYLLRGPPEGEFPSRFLSVGRSVGREAPIVGTVGRCPWDCR